MILPRQVGLIGLGLLGTALAERFVGAGFEVIGFDVDPSRAAALAERGVRPATNAEALAALPTIVLCLPDSSIVADVIGRLESHLWPGQLIIDTTTGLPADAVALEARLRRLGIQFGEATLLGSSEVVRQGQALAMLGGDAEWFTLASPVISTFAAHLFPVGPAGSGARMKLVVNLVLGLHRAVLAEGLTLAEGYGLDLERTLDVLRAGAAYSRVMDAKGPKMIDREYAPQAKLAQHLKDVRLILQEAASVGASTPLSAVHELLLTWADANGFGPQDNAAIIEAYRHHRPSEK